MNSATSTELSRCLYLPVEGWTQEGRYMETQAGTGDQSSREADKSAVGNFSIVVGGPVYDLLLRFHLVRQTLPNVWRRIIALMALI